MCSIGRDKVCCWLVRLSQFFPVCAAEQVLGHFRPQFIDIVDANAIVHELEHQDIISNGDWNTIRKNPDATEQNQYLHRCLLKKCDEKALRKVCKIIIAVKGNPRMKSLGKKMKSVLGGKYCVLVYVCTCVCVCEFTATSCCSILHNTPVLCVQDTGQTVLCSTKST